MKRRLRRSPGNPRDRRSKFQRIFALTNTQARAAALRQERAKADALAAEAGVRITSVLRIEELDGHEHRGFRTDHGVMYSQIASASFEHEELSAATREVEYTFRLRFGIEPRQR